MHKTEQINDLLRFELAKLIEEHVNLDGVLITVSYVDCSPDLRYAKIFISVLPEKFFGSAITELKKHSGAFSKYLRKHTRLRQIPKLVWTVDDTEAKAAVIDEILKSIR